MKKIVDQYHGDPTYAQLHVLTSDRPLVREMLKTAAFEEKKAELDNLPDTAFAWEEERRFPIHTREDVLASILYRSKTACAVPRYVDDKLGKASEIYKLDAHMFTSKTASDPVKTTEYALPESQRLPLDNAHQVKVAETVLCRDYTRLPLEKRADAFSRLAMAATKHGVDLTPQSKRMAGLTISKTAEVCDWLEARAAASTGKVQAAFDKLASELRAAPALVQDRKELVKLASAIDTLDRMAGLDRHYDRKLPDPLHTVFNTVKVAQATCDVAGMPVPCADLMALPPDMWDQLDAPEIAEVAASGDEVTFQQVFATLPLDVKLVLREQLER